MDEGPIAPSQQRRIHHRPPWHYFQVLEPSLAQVAEVESIKAAL